MAVPGFGDRALKSARNVRSHEYNVKRVSGQCILDSSQLEQDAKGEPLAVQLESFLVSVFFRL